MKKLSTELADTQEAFRSYKVRAHSALKQRDTTKEQEQEEKILDLSQQVVIELSLTNCCIDCKAFK